MNWLDEAAEEVAAQNRKDWDASQTPEALARAAKKKAEEFERGVRLGWWDAEGNPLLPDEPEDDEETEDEE